MRHAALALWMLAAIPAAAAGFFQTVEPPRPFQVMAHRGMMQQAPENTRPAIEAAIADCIEWVEVDLRLTRDGRHVLFHDAVLDAKTDGAGPVADHTLAELEALDAGAWFAPRFRGVRLLSLEAALQLAKGRVNLYLDCKTVDPEGLAAAIAAAEMQRQVAVFAGLDTLRRVHAAAPDIPLMPKWRPEYGLEAWPGDVQPAAVEIDAVHLTPEVCAAFHARGMRVQAKVLGADDRPAVWDRVLEAGADWLQTDKPGEILAHRLWPPAARRPMLMACHRGACRHAPENTLPAIEKAVRLGADFIELDVRASKDGAFFLMHDATLDKTTALTGRLADRDAALLHTLDAGAWFGPGFTGAAIPTFDQALEALHGRAQLYLDAKAIDAKAIAQHLERHGMTEHCVVYGSPFLLRELRALEPRIRRLCPLSNPRQIDRLCDALAPYAFDASWDILSAELIAQCHARGVKVFSDAMGGHERQADYHQAIGWGLDLIQTDTPLRLIEAVRTYGAAQSPRVQ